MATKKRARAKAGTRQEQSGQPDLSHPGLPEWRWRTFPVFFAFFLGALIMAVLNGAPDNEFAAIAQFAVLAALSYGLARIVVRKLFAERRAGKHASGGDAEGDYEDVLVYPEAPSKR